MSRRWIIFSAAVLVSIILLPDCACRPEPEDRDAVIRIGTIHRVITENPLYDYALGIFTLISNPPLLQLNSRGEINGMLADSYDCSSDYTSWKFIIGKNYYWNDGQPVTPADVKFSIEYQGKHVPSRRWLQKTLVKTEITADHGVIFTFNKPYSRLDMEFITFHIFPRHVWEKITRPEYFTAESADKSIYLGYGPFVISRIDLNAGLVVMERNPFWQGKKPAVEKIEIHLFQNIDMLSLSLEKGQVDSYYKYADSYPYTNIPRLRSTGNFEFLQNSALSVVFLGFNLGKKPLSDFAFRSAIVHALDYEELVRLESLGYGEIPGAGFVTPDMTYYRETGKLKQDIDRAKELLRSAGYNGSDGDRAIEDSRGENIELLLLSTPTYLRLCELVKDYIQRLGIFVVVKIVDDASWIEMKDRCHYDIVISNTSPWGMRTYAGWATAYFDARRTGEGVLHNVADPFFLKLCDAISTTREPGKLKRFAHEVQDYYAGKFPAVALTWKKAIIPCNKRFSGWYIEPIYGIFNVQNFLNLKRINAFH